MTTGQLSPAAEAPRDGMPPPDMVVTLDGLTKSFPRRTGWRELLRHPLARETVVAVDGVSLEVRRGEFFGLLGPNGAGKTTLFKILSTLITPDAGEAWVAGYEVGRQPAGVRAQLAPVVPEERSLNWRLTARQNLDLFGALHGLGKRERARRISELLQVVGLEGTGAKLVAEFSSGMRQRLLLARALIPRPRVLLLDEPTRSLDPLSARTLRSFLRTEVVGQQGCTVLLATHNAEEAFDLCDRVGVLHKGRLLATGGADELARRYARDRYRLVVRGPFGPALGELEAGGAVQEVAIPPGDSDGWVAVEAVIPGGATRAAAVLAFLARAGIEVASFEPIRVTLADLIERIVHGPSAGEAG